MKQKIIGITGTNGAGKDTIINYLIKHHNFKQYSAREFIYKEIDRRGLERNRDTLISVANDIRKQNGPSIRTVGEVQALENKPNFELWAVDAPYRGEI